MINKFSRIQKIIFAGAIVVSLFFLFSQTIIGERIYFPGWTMEKIKNFLSENELSAKDYKDSTIILVKPIATGVGEGRYEAGDVVEIRDGEELYKRFGTGDFLGKEEKKNFLAVYIDRKLTDLEKQALMEIDYKITGYGENGRPIQETIKRRKMGIDYTEFLNSEEILTIRNMQELKKIPKISEENFKVKLDKRSIVQLPQYLTKIEKARNTFRKIIAKIIPFVYAGTGGTKTICTSGCDYTTLNLWEAGEQGVLASPAIAQITEGFLDTTAVIIDGWTTSATNYIYIYTTAAARHDGKWNTSKYILSVSPSSNAVLYILESNVMVEGLQISHTGTVDATFGLSYYLVGNIQISHNIIRYTGGGSNIYRGISGDSSGVIKIWNNIIYDFNTSSSVGIRLGGGSTGTHYLYNNTIHNSTTGISHGAGTTYAKNNLIRSCPTATSGLTAANCGYNATDLASLGYTAQTGDRVSQIFTFVLEASDDFHLASTDAGAKDQWGNVYADANLAVTTDIDGDARPNGLLGDIGADECHLTPLPASGDVTPKTRIKGNVRIKGGVEFR